MSENRSDKPLYNSVDKGIFLVSPGKLLVTFLNDIKHRECEKIIIRLRGVGNSF